MARPRKPTRPAAVTAAGEHAEDAWDALLTDVEEHELTASRRAGMEALALQVARMRAAAELVQADGLTVMDADGRTHPHPALAIERAAAAEIRDWTKHLT